jgi:uncharacterized coiled-coil protein SlyX
MSKFTLSELMQNWNRLHQPFDAQSYVSRVTALESQLATQAQALKEAEGRLKWQCEQVEKRLVQIETLKAERDSLRSQNEKRFCAFHAEHCNRTDGKNHYADGCSICRVARLGEENQSLRSQLAAKELLLLRTSEFISALGYAGDLTVESAQEFLRDKLVHPTPSQRDADESAAGWLHKAIVDKHATGPALDGQIQIDGVWGTPSSHLHFSQEEPTDRWIYWKAPVYFLSALPKDVKLKLSEGPTAQEIADLKGQLEAVTEALVGLRDGIDTPETHCPPVDPSGSHRYVIDAALAKVEAKL